MSQSCENRALGNWTYFIKVIRLEAMSCCPTWRV